MNNRFSKHKTNYRQYLAGKLDYYVSAFDILKRKDAYIELYKDYPCKTKQELFRKEGKIIKKTKNHINKVIAGRTKKEGRKIWENNNKNKISKNKRDYYKKNKERIKDQRRQRYEKNKEKIRTDKEECECGSIYRKIGKRMHEKTNKHKNYITNNTFNIQNINITIPKE